MAPATGPTLKIAHRGVAIDLSDGLAGDLRHLLSAGRVGAELLTSAIPVSRAAKQQARAGASAKSPLQAALTDGEDFELLFCVDKKQAVPLMDTWKKQFPAARLSCIGKITAGTGLKLRGQHGFLTTRLTGYTHFNEPGANGESTES